MTVTYSRNAVDETETASVGLATDPEDDSPQEHRKEQVMKKELVQVRNRCVECGHPISPSNDWEHTLKCAVKHAAKGERRTLRGGRRVYNTWATWKKLEEKLGDTPDAGTVGGD